MISIISPSIKFAIMSSHIALNINKSIKSSNEIIEKIYIDDQPHCVSIIQHFVGQDITHLPIDRYIAGFHKYNYELAHQILNKDEEYKTPAHIIEELESQSDELWESDKIQAELMRGTWSQYVYTNGYCSRHEIKGMARLVINMIISDHLLIIKRIGREPYENPLGTLIGEIHESLELWAYSSYSTFYAVATILRYYIYNIVNANGWHAHDLELLQSALWDNAIYSAASTWSYIVNDKMGKPSHTIMKQGADYISTLTVTSGITTVSILAEYAVWKIETKITEHKQRINNNDILITAIAAPCYEDIALIKCATAIDSEALKKANYWADVITPKGYKLNVKHEVYMFMTILMIIFLLCCILSICFSDFWVMRLIDTTSFLSLVLLLEGASISAFTSVYKDNWSWHDMMRGQVFVKDWNQLPQKYKTDAAIKDYITFIMRNHDLAKYMDPNSNCYLHGLAAGDIIGPKPVKVSMMRECGAIIMNTKAHYILIGTPRNNSVASMRALEAVLTSHGYYHVVGYMDTTNVYGNTDESAEIG
jgi:hypothetical protein